MPAKAPRSLDLSAARLRALGGQIRAHRKALRVNATATAQAAGMSRVTLHRIEAGEPSVTMGAYLNAIAALGLDLAIRTAAIDRTAQVGALEAETAEVPQPVRLADYPQLRQIAWGLRGIDALTPAEALGLYERNWRHLDLQAMEPREQSLVQALRRAREHENVPK